MTIQRTESTWTDRRLPGSASAPLRNALRFAGGYALLGAVWILLSDTLVALLPTHPERLLSLQTYKGWFFVVITAALLFGLLYRHFRREEAAFCAVRESQALLRAVAEGTPDAVFVKDLQGRYLLANSGALAFLDKPLEQVIGREDKELVSLEDARTINSVDRQVLDSGTTQTFEEHLHVRGNARIFLSIKGPIWDSQGKLAGLFGIARDITTRTQAEDALRQSEQQLRALSSRLDRLREEERTRISREIHDELGQMLTAIKMDLRWMEHRFDVFGDDQRVNPILDRLLATAELADATVKTVQRIAAELRPGILDKLGLSMALQYEASQFEERTGISCVLKLPETESSLSPEATTAFFRIFQEALTNVMRHANATRVEAEFKTGRDECILEIMDNGKGIAGLDLANPKSLGLLGMRERAHLLGGNVTFSSRSEGGTMVLVRMPNSRVDTEAS